MSLTEILAESEVHTASVEDVNAVKAPVPDAESETITPLVLKEEEPVPPLATPKVPEVT